jgi:hypothetical protein
MDNATTNKRVEAVISMTTQSALKILGSALVENVLTCAQELPAQLINPATLNMALASPTQLLDINTVNFKCKYYLSIYLYILYIIILSNCYHYQPHSHSHSHSPF